MTAFTREEAENLYSILDENIGVFREEEMPESAQKFYEKKKQEFLDVFSTEIPETYWFQGTICRSVSLIKDPEHGFILKAEIDPGHTVHDIIEKTNKKIRKASLI